MDGDIAVRPVRSPDDDVFDLSVYASTRLPELTALDWTPQQIDDFIGLQYRAQSRHYRQQYPDAAYSVVTVVSEPAGRLIVARSDQEIRIVDIALLPEYQGRGIGGILVRRLLAEADEAGVPLRCHVEQSNTARGFWEHLGLVAVRIDGAHIVMDRTCVISPH
jgi:ribosomal protein S18 acetylase RimI-like enzyme